MRKYTPFVFAGLALFAGLAVFGLCMWWRARTKLAFVTHRGTTMGSTFAVTWGETAPHPAVPHEVNELLLRLTRLMSTYDPDSELSAFNRSESTDWIAVAPELAEVVSIAQAVSAESAGVFDVTVKPLVAAWGFGPDAAREPPPKEQLDAAASVVGHARLLVRSTPPALRKRVSGLQVDLNAIAPGYAADQVALLLERQGLGDYLIDVGGELRIAGHAPERERWRVGVVLPNPQADKPAQPVPNETLFELTDTALATSGDYRNYYELAGKRISHTIDPRTFRPIDHRLASVTVLAPTAALADARATALNVWGPDEGLRRAVAHDWSVLMLVRVDGERFEQRRTGWFADQTNAE